MANLYRGMHTHFRIFYLVFFILATMSAHEDDNDDDSEESAKYKSAALLGTKNI